MSAVLVRSAIEAALAGISPAIDTSYENGSFVKANGSVGSPTVGVPYQRLTVLLAQPANDEFGAAYREEGFLQVDLNYPLNAGPSAAETRAELIRSTFTRGATFTASGQKVHITKTPEIRPGRVEADRYVKPVRIPFHAHIGS